MKSILCGKNSRNYLESIQIFLGGFTNSSLDIALAYQDSDGICLPDV